MRTFGTIDPSMFGRIAGYSLLFFTFWLQVALTAEITSVSIPSGGHAATVESANELTVLHLRMQLDGNAALALSDIAYAKFPSGKRCAFTYDGVRLPKTVAFFQKLGFRTTIPLSPGTPEEQVKALEDAGAEIATVLWGLKNGCRYTATGGCTQQECYDMALSRIALKAMCRGPVALGQLGSSNCGDDYWTNRDPFAKWGYVFHDSNYLANCGAHDGFPIFLRREGAHVQAYPSILNSSLGTNEKAPSELVYYQLLVNKFRGTLLLKKKGQIVRYSLRDFKDDELARIEAVIGEWGRHPLIWHATEGEICSNEYLRQKSRVLAVKPCGANEWDVSIGLERDIFPPFLMAPLSLQFPKGFPLKSARLGASACPVFVQDDAVYLDVPLQAAFRNGVELSFLDVAPDMTIPDEMPLTLSIKNTSDKALTDARLQWTGSIELKVSGGEQEPFTLEAKAERKIKAVVVTSRGARFGVTPIEAILTGKVDGEERTFLAGYEIVVAPRLRVKVDPTQCIPMLKDREQHFLVHIANAKAHWDGDPPFKLIHHKTKTCKGVASFDLPPGMEVTPLEQPFELAEDGQTTLVFKLKNNVWGKELVWVRPKIRMEGVAEVLELPFPGTPVTRDQEQLEYKPLDEKGLLLYASWEDKDKAGAADHAAGNHLHATSQGPKHSYSTDGIKGWCLGFTNEECVFYHTRKNINSQEGTILFWMRRNSQLKNEMVFKPDPNETWKLSASQYCPGETLISGGESACGAVQRVMSSNGSICLRRWPGLNGKDGYLELTYIQMGGNNIKNLPNIHVQVPFEKARLFEWRHVAMLWQVKERRLELYLDGKLVGKADPGQTEWYAVPWDGGVVGEAGSHKQCISPGSNDHGKTALTLRDEFYIYNRALTEEEIRANMELVKNK